MEIFTSKELLMELLRRAGYKKCQENCYVPGNKEYSMIDAREIVLKSDYSNIVIDWETATCSFFFDEKGNLLHETNNG